MLRQGRGLRGIAISNDIWTNVLGPEGRSNWPAAAWRTRQPPVQMHWFNVSHGNWRSWGQSVLRSMRQFQMNPLYLFFLIDTSMHLNVVTSRHLRHLGTVEGILTDVMTSSWPRLT